MSRDPTYPLFPIFSLTASLLVLVPLPWHLQAWNSGTCFYIVWTFIASLNQFVNSIVWASDAIDRAPLWCDISTRIVNSSAIGIPAASLCIVRRLYNIASVQRASVTRADKRRQVIVDTCISLLFPIVATGLQIIVQGHRYDIWEGVGCVPAMYNTPLAYVLVSMWPTLIGTISAVYCILALLAFRRRQIEFNNYLRSNKSLTVGRYFRLMALAMAEVSLTTPLSVVSIIVNVKNSPPQPWISWADTHEDFWRVDQYPALLWRQSKLAVFGNETNRWLPVVCALLFFAFFGFAEEARKNYKAASTAFLKFTKLDAFFSKIRSRTDRKSLKPFSLRTDWDSQNTLPVYMPYTEPKSKSDKPRPSTEASNIIVLGHDNQSTFNGPPSPSSSAVPSYYEMMHTPTSSTFCPSSPTDGPGSPKVSGKHTSTGSISELDHRSTFGARPESATSSMQPRAV
ncbi:pheromone A receptor-domain-containing protein [Pterulicium gracile]|uniref:Pheromone A receptor-domain-containing protein n=1 Tax=Pterulicium gracile TaxID=1884261 RepID=A0A5C3Q4H7_9AGAR|nr:pheromone A receptor-domain-containing protein [Pterula gracilis]